MNRLARCASAVAVAALFVLPTLASDWPQFRGPARDGRSAESGLLQSWPEGGPALAWKTAGVGNGYSSLAIVGGRIYTMGDLGEAGQHVIALEDGTGKLLWKTHVGPSHKDKYIGSRSTPTVDGDRLYVVTTEGDVVCLATADGAELWRRSMTKDFHGFLMKAMGSYDWKFAESPLVDGDKVIVTPGHVEALMVALDKKTGKDIWRTQGARLGVRGADGAAYSSAVVSEAGGVRQYVQLVGRGVIGVEAETGKLLWWWNRVANDIANISTPVVHGDYVFASTAYGAGAGLIHVHKGEDGWKADEVWFVEGNVMQNHHGGLILDGNTVFTASGHNKGFPIAADLMTGKIMWGPERNEGKGTAAVTYADGRLYMRYEGGRMYLVDASPEAYKERGTFTIPDVDNFSWSYPVIANGKLYLREQDNLYVYDVHAGSDQAGKSSRAAKSDKGA